jgi:Rrf2 family protein
MATALRISEAASLGLHATACVAARTPEPVSCREMAALLGVSEAHLAKVLQRLVRYGLMRSARGPKGGFVLARPADQIRLIEVYQAVEGPLRLSPCLLGQPVCGTGRCILGPLLTVVNRQLTEALEGTTVAELALFGARPDPKQRRLGNAQS